MNRDYPYPALVRVTWFYRGDKKPRHFVAARTAYDQDGALHIGRAIFACMISPQTLYAWRLEHSDLGREARKEDMHSKATNWRTISRGKKDA